MKKTKDAKRKAEPTHNAPSEMSIEQKVARFNEICATAPVDRTEEDTLLMKKLAPEVSEYQKRKIAGRLGMQAAAKAQPKQPVAPVTKRLRHDSYWVTRYAPPANIPANEIFVSIRVILEEDDRQAFGWFDEKGSLIDIGPYINSDSKDREQDGCECDEMSVFELFTESYETLSLQTIGCAAWNGQTYHVVTPFSSKKVADDEAMQVFIMKKVRHGNESSLEELTDKALAERIFTVFARVAVGSYEYVSPAADIVAMTR